MLEKKKYLNDLEAESIFIIRETLAEAKNPVILYSIGKDSSVLLHLIIKSFYPSKVDIPLLHIDTGWKFSEMYSFREKVIKKYNLNCIIYKNNEGEKKGINPFTYSSNVYTDVMKTQALKQALDKYKFDFAFGGARRDEEKSRAKERVFSIRTEQHNWDPKHQRPEIWNLFNLKIHNKQNVRVFPLSNWTELDIWEYIHKEKISISSLYYAKKRPVVLKNNTLIMVDDNRMQIKKNEKIIKKLVRFRTLGCYPLSGAIQSEANTLSKIIEELNLSKKSERSGRLIDTDQTSSMELKKTQGYF
ncbi:MAG: sulfate adenylyltransferase small subunit [Cellvibrionales bacterium TMED122]|nr:MAG: sulfate adenylyltransferase small subunit [Cellvibrionales bacterium TMED122]